jgi:hypothetical protein
MDNNEKELMDQLKGIIDNAGSDYLDKAEQEAKHIFTEMVKAFDSDLPQDLETILLGIQKVDDEDEIAEAKAGMRQSVKSQFLDNLDDPEAQCMRVKPIIGEIEPDNFIDMLHDTETAMLLSAWFEPTSLVSRVKRNGVTLHVMALPNAITYIKTLATGDTITKYWGNKRDADGNIVYPEPSEFDDQYEYDLVRGTYKYLAMPMEMKQDSPQAYETLLQAISEKVQRQVRNSFGDDDDEA